MPLQNRVTPYSTIEASSARGLFMGNRGRLHDNHRHLVSQRWKTKIWIVCELSFQERQREVMHPQHYTELFFLDEAVALAAGHRPCSLCRRTAYRAFLDAWAGASGELARAFVLDAALHTERIAHLQGNPYPRMPLGELPDGTFVRSTQDVLGAWLKHDGRLLEWSHTGYKRAECCPDASIVEVLTPSSTLLALRAVNQPALHPSVHTL